MGLNMNAKLLDIEIDLFRYLHYSNCRLDDRYNREYQLPIILSLVALQH